MASKKDNSFSADSIKIGNLKHSLSESAEGDLVFKDVKIPEGVKLFELASGAGGGNANRTELVAVSGALYTIIQNISASLQEQISDNYALLTIVSGSIYSTIQSVSASLQEEISDNYVYFEEQISNNYTSLVNISGSLYSTIQNVSGYLQTEITDNRNEVIAVSGNLYTIIMNTSATNHSELVGVSGNLYTIITDVSGYLQSEIVNISGNLYSLITSVSGYLQSELVGVSGYLQSEIIALSATDVTLSTAISGIQNRFDFVDTLGISGSFTKISCIPLTDTNKVVWELVAIDEDDIAHRYSSTVAAIHNGSTGVSWTEYAIMYTGVQTPLQIRVTNDGTNMCLEVSE